MALHARSLWKAVKPNFFALCTAALAESPTQTRGILLESRIITSYVMTSYRRLLIDLGKCAGNGRSQDGKENKRNNSNFALMFVPALFKGFMNDSSTDKPDPEQDLVNIIKRSILLMQKGEVDKAERLLHVALKMAQDLNHDKGITYIYDTMANLAFESGQHAKAQKLFVDVLRRLVGRGLPQDDIVVVNISLKIADSFAALSEHEKAEQGFLFCINTLKTKISAGAKDEDTLMLYSQALDRYSLFLQHVNKPKEALKFMETAIEIAESTLGHIDNGIGAILLADMGTIKIAAGDKEGGSLCFDKALTIANQEEVDASVAVIMVNRGAVLNDIGLYEDAKYWCGVGLKEAAKEKNKAVLKAAEACLKVSNEIVNKSEKGVTYSPV